MASISQTDLIEQNKFSPSAGRPLGLDEVDATPHTVHKRSLWLRFVAFPYYGPLHYYTIDPMNRICEKQDDLAETIKLLCLFKSRKTEEITFVRVAATLSAAASIGSLSWPDITDAMWAAKWFLVISLYMSIFALVSTAALRQLDYFPNKTTAIFSEREVHAMLSLLLNFPKEVQQSLAIVRSDTDCEASSVPGSKWCRVRGVPSRYKKYFWQISMMLMAGSWLCYLLGVTLYVITPFTRMKLDAVSTDGIASGITFFLAMIISANFLITNNRAFTLLDAAKQRGLREDSELVSRDNKTW